MMGGCSPEGGGSSWFEADHGEVGAETKGEVGAKVLEVGASPRMKGGSRSVSLLCPRRLLLLRPTFTSGN